MWEAIAIGAQVIGGIFSGGQAARSARRQTEMQIKLVGAQAEREQEFVKTMALYAGGALATILVIRGLSA